MILRIRTSPSQGRTSLLMTCLALASVVLLTGASKSRPITKPKLDPTAEVVSLFDGIEQQTVEVKYIAKNSKGGNLLITNKTDSPLTIEMPKAFAAVHVLKQVGGGNFGGGGIGGGIGGGGGDKPVETLSLNFAKIEWNYIAQKESGGGAGNVPGTWDIALNKAA